jgi:hypothetical protein
MAILKMPQPVHFISYGSYFAPCDYIADQSHPERQTERRREVTCARRQALMTDIGDLPEPVLDGRESE